MREMTFQLDRGEVYIRETAAASFVISWYPRERSMPDWPGRITEAERYRDFPFQAMMRGHRAVVEEWVKRQTW